MNKNDLLHLISLSQRLYRELRGDYPEQAKEVKIKIDEMNKALEKLNIADLSKSIEDYMKLQANIDEFNSAANKALNKLEKSNDRLESFSKALALIEKITSYMVSVAI